MSDIQIILNTSKQNKTNGKNKQKAKTNIKNQIKANNQIKHEQTNKPCNWCIVSSKWKHENFSSRWVSRLEFYYSLQPGEVRLWYLLCHPRVKLFSETLNHNMAPYSCTLYSDHCSTLAWNDSFNPKENILWPLHLLHPPGAGRSTAQGSRREHPFPNSFSGPRGLCKKCMLKFSQWWWWSTKVYRAPLTTGNTCPLLHPFFGFHTTLSSVLPVGRFCEMQKRLTGDINWNLNQDYFLHPGLHFSPHDMDVLYKERYWFLYLFLKGIFIVVCFLMIFILIQIFPIHWTVLSSEISVLSYLGFLLRKV